MSLRQNDSHHESHPEELLADLVASVEQALTAGGIEAVTARKAGFAAAESLRKRWGGMMLYFPKGRHFEAAQKHLAVWADFDGHNHREVAQKHGLSEPAVYRIVKEMLSQQVRLRQRDIFDESAGQG